MEAHTTKLIAKFMDMIPELDGWAIPNPHMIPSVTRQNVLFSFEETIEDWKEDKLTIWDAFQFDSWEWIMPVVAKIEGLGFNVSNESRQEPFWKEIKTDSVVSIGRFKGKTVTQFLDNSQQVLAGKLQSAHELSIYTYYYHPADRLKATCEAVVRFIEWYNENKLGNSK